MYGQLEGGIILPYSKYMCILLYVKLMVGVVVFLFGVMVLHRCMVNWS